MPPGRALTASARVWPSPQPKSNTAPALGTKSTIAWRSSGTKRSRWSVPSISTRPSGSHFNRRENALRYCWCVSSAVNSLAIMSIASSNRAARRRVCSRSI